MTTREELREIIRMRLGDLAETPVLTDDQINQWINDAIREYGIHFPRRAELHITCLEGVREYALNGRTDESGLTSSGTRHVLRVEYPYNEDPPQILIRRSELDTGGFLGEKVYDVRDSPEMILVIGLAPQGTETIAAQLACDHPLLDQDTSVTTLPDQHLELIILFVRLLALQELAATEASDPSPTGVILTGLASMVSRAQEEYAARLAEYRLSSSPGSRTTGWDEHRVY
jgi:hypothetical protein